MGEATDETVARVGCFGWAFLSSTSLPFISSFPVPSSWLSKRSETDSSSNVTKPNPLDRCVTRSIITVESSIIPNCAKKVRNSSSVTAGRGNMRSVCASVRKRQRSFTYCRLEAHPRTAFSSLAQWVALSGTLVYPR